MSIKMRPAAVTDTEAEQALRTFLYWIGEDPDRPGLRETPRRIMSAWREDWGRGYQDTIGQHVRVFPEPSQSRIPPDQIVMVGNITVMSMCEHHLAPFFGTAVVAYIPSNQAGGIVGLSKFARIVDHFARRLQVQERLTEQIADYVSENIATGTGCGVLIRAKHMCMISRGVREPASVTTTSAMRGAFFTQRETRAEFFGMVNGNQNHG